MYRLVGQNAPRGTFIRTGTSSERPTGPMSPSHTPPAPARVGLGVTGPGSRPAGPGELCERFIEMPLIEKKVMPATAANYREEGKSFQ
jgi:hypothetical protein